MSIRIMQRVWETPCRTHTEKLVLLALADNASDEGECWPSQATIARKTDLSEQGVRNQLAALEKRGWLKVRKSQGKTANRYLLTLNAVDPQPGGGLKPTLNAVGGQPSTPLAITPNAVAPNHQEPSSEPSPSPARSAEASKPSEHTAFVKAWADAYEEVFGDPYIFAGGKDGSAVKRLLKTGVPVPELLAIARAAWGRNQLFNCKQAASIAGFAGRLNDIRAELRGGKKATPSKVDGWEEEVNAPLQ